MINNKYKYSILKYQHSALLGESLNIGVLIYFPYIDKFVFNYSKNLTRIKAIYDIVSEKTIKHYLSQIELRLRKFSSEYELFEKDKYEYFDQFIDQFILPNDGSVLQFSKNRESYFYNQDIEYIISNLTNKYLFEKEKNIAGVTISKEPLILKKFYNYLSVLDLDHNTSLNHKFYKNYKVRNETGNEFNFEYGWNNDSLHLVKPISFDLKDSKNLADKAYKNFGLFTDLKNEAIINNLKYDLLIGKPESKELFKEFDHALNLLNMLDRVEIILEENIEDYSQKAITAILNI